jgi:hypothetical protein
MATFAIDVRAEQRAKPDCDATGSWRDLMGVVRSELAAELSRRELIDRAGRIGLGALVLGAAPIAMRMASPEPVAAQSGLPDGTLQAFFDTIIPGRAVPELRTELGDPIHPQAIAGVDAEHGAVYTDALRLARNPKIGFATIEAPFLADLEARSLAEGGPFLDLDYDARERVCLSGLDFDNPDRPVWEAGAAVAFTAFCAAATIVNATGRGKGKRSAAGYEVMGHPGTAPHGYRQFSYRRRLNRGRTRRGYLA